MHPILGTCPVCGDTMTVTRLHCRSCETTVDGQFAIGAFDRLTPEQLTFAEVFIRCEGKLNRVEKELNLSYPTLRTRLGEIIRAMGYEVGQEEGADAATVSDDERRRILDDLASGKIASGDAVKMLRGE
ncbi:MAG: DUF2089 domain-containing protein [Chloroflexi bacterium]|nr:DUF2089 domain-containing protein [Chloroflexota bacterium]